MDLKKEEILRKELRIQRAIEEKLKKEAYELRQVYTKKTLELISGGFGLIAALAWNELITEVVNDYIKPLFGQRSGLISLFIYAVFVTALVVLVSYNLSKFTPKDKT